MTNGIMSLGFGPHQGRNVLVFLLVLLLVSTHRIDAAANAESTGHNISLSEFLKPTTALLRGKTRLERKTRSYQYRGSLSSHRHRHLTQQQTIFQAPFRESTGITAANARGGSLGKLATSISEGNEDAIKAQAEKLLSAQTREQLNGCGQEDFVATQVTFDPSGRVHVRAKQVMFGMEVEGAAMMIHLETDGTVYAMNGEFVDDRIDEQTYNLVTRSYISDIDSQTQLDRALEEAGITNGQWLAEPKLTIVRRESDGTACMAWKRPVAYVKEEDSPGAGRQIDMIFADATVRYHKSKYYPDPPSLCAIHPQIQGDGSPGVPCLRTYDCRNAAPWPVDCTANLISDSSDRINSGDPAADDAHNYAIDTYNYFWNKFARNSIDDEGMMLISNVHYDVEYNNAFWDGSQMTYGDGDGSLFIPLSQAADVVAHELTHGITERTSNLVYRYESGAVNEAMSDIFGAAVERELGKTGDDVWYIGEDITVFRYALRNMRDPAEYNDYDYYPTRYVGTEDNGGVHWNSGILNLAFYLLSEGGSHPRGTTSTVVNGIGFDDAAFIMYYTNTACLTVGATFAQTRFCTLTYSFMPPNDYTQNINDAYDAVGVPAAEDARDFIQLEDGVTLSGQTSELRTVQYYTFGPIDADEGVTCTTTGNNGDADLYIAYNDIPFNGGTLQCSSATSGTSNEECSTFSPGVDNTDVFIGIYALEPYSDLSITCTIEAVTPPDFLDNNVPIDGISLETGEAKYWLFTYTLQPGDEMTCTTRGLNGDADLLVYFGQLPQNGGTLECGSFTGSSNEDCFVVADTVATAYIGVEAFAGFTDLTLLCSVPVTSPVPIPAPAPQPIPQPAPQPIPQPAPQPQPVSQTPPPQAPSPVPAPIPAPLPSPVVMPSPVTMPTPTMPVPTAPPVPCMTEPLFDDTPIDGLAAIPGERLRFHFQKTLNIGDELTCYTYGDNGDADLYIYFGGASCDDGVLTCLDNSGNSNEFCMVITSDFQEAYVELRAHEAFTDLTLHCFLNIPLDVIEDGIAQIGVQAVTGEPVFFEYAEPVMPGYHVECITNGNNGDADLLMVLGGDPRVGPFDCVSTTPRSSNEICTVHNHHDEPHVLHISVYAYQGFTNLRLQCDRLGSDPTPPPASSPTEPPTGGSACAGALRKVSGAIRSFFQGNNNG